MASAENQANKSKRDMMSERLRSRYPDREFADDESMYGQISDDYDAYDKELSGYKEREKQLVDMFSSDPRSAQFLMNWRNGDDPVVSLVRQFGTDIKEALDDPARLEDIASANKEYLERVAKEKELEDEYQKNLAESLSYLEKFQSENGLSDEEVDRVMEHLIGVVKDGVMGKFTAETIDMAMKALNHDADVAAADHDAEVRGRNAQIDERVRKRNQGDGVPMLGGSNTTVRQGNRSIFDEARGAV